MTNKFWRMALTDEGRPAPRFFFGAFGAARRRGFTTIELVVTLLIAGILAAVAMPKMSSRTSLDELGFADQLRSAIRYAQKLSLAQRRNICVRFTPTGVALNYFDSAGNSCVNAAAQAAAVVEPGSGSPYVLATPAGVAFMPALPTSFRFDNALLGAPAAANGPALALPTQTLTIGSRSIVVERGSGYVH